MHYTLENGLEVILAPETVGSQVGVAVTYYTGHRDDPPGYEGLAHLVEHMTFRGSRHLPGSLRAPLLAAGITDHNGFTFRDDTIYYEVVPAQQLPLALWIESERMAFSLERFDQNSLELERAIVLRERAEHSSVDSRLPQFVAETLYPVGHPYRRIYREANREKSLELDHARWFFQTFYRPRNATLTHSAQQGHRSRRPPAQRRASVERIPNGIRPQDAARLHT